MIGREWGILGSFELAAHLHEIVGKRPDDFGRAFLESVKLGWSMTPEIWDRGAELRSELNAWCARTFDRFDLVVTPTVPYDAPAARGPFPAETEGRRQIGLSVASFTIPFNLSWHPAATVRAGMSRKGLPIGMQLVGPRHRDDLVLAAARAFERERPWHPHWPSM
jgi:aspartyl-tRNA(Asn)/glutamyl-tRNA(Gln) amidotransferase subunit A